MLSSFSSNAIMTKAKAMYGKRLTREQYVELMHKKTVSDIATYLRDETNYSEALQSIQPSQVHRGQLENTLQKSRYNVYLRLMRYVSPENEEFYGYLIHQVEVELILQMIRLLGNGHPEDFVTQYPSYLERKACFSMMDLARVRSFDELVEFLRPTPYGEPLEKCRPTDGQTRIDYTKCETTLRSFYYKRVAEVIDSCFRGKVREQLRDIFGTSIEISNITNIYRLKKFYPNMTSEEIYATLLPSWRKMTQREISEIIGAPTAEDFLKVLSKSRFSKYLGSQDFVYIEYSQANIKYRLNRRYLRFSNDAPTAFAAYMVLSEIEISNIISIIESVRYHIPASEIEKMLVIS